MLSLMTVDYVQISTELPEGRTDSETTFKLIKHWLQECDAQHPMCKIPEISHWLPSRLIYIGTNELPALQLCESAPPGSPYASLSHCWGDYTPLKLLLSNFVTFKQQLPDAELPRTFHDAISVARQLSIQYLWIDSLCIIQDLKEDWAKESVSMDQVYSNAVLNIAATAAKDSRQGLFSKRHPLTVQLCKVDIGWDHVKEDPATEYSAKENRGDYAIVCVSTWEDEVNRSPLVRRAWICQERLLSRRNLHYGNGQVFWECAQHGASELFPKGYKEIYNSQTKQKIRSRKIELSDGLDRMADVKTKAKIQDMWSEIVETYTTCDLTYGTDKVVAIAGLAKYWRTLWGTPIRYFAGIWDYALPFQLLWSKSSYMGPNYGTWTRQEEYRAPTWSWASVNGPVDITWSNSSIHGPITAERIDNSPGGKFRQAVLIIIDRVQMDYLSEDQFGPVRGGRIHISCRLAPVCVVSREHDTDGMSLSLKLYLECLITIKRATIRTDVNFKHGLRTLGVFRDIFFMPILRTATESKGTTLRGILLEEVQGTPGTFRRFGWCLVFEEEAPLFQEAMDYFDLHADERELNYSQHGEGGIHYQVEII